MHARGRLHRLPHLRIVERKCPLGFHCTCFTTSTSGLRPQSPHTPPSDYASAPPACRRAACRTLSWHESSSRAWQVALTEPKIAHNKQNNDNDTDDSEDAHVTLLLLLGTRKLCTQPGSSRSPGYGLACGALVPRLIETPCNAFIKTTIRPASRAICDILAINVGIVRKSSGCGADIPPRVVHAATRAPPPDGEARSRLLHTGTCCVEAVAVRWVDGGAPPP
jgi:hypothetical protein